ncbi:TAT-variant-translocated molybdopterin oxidoreductase [bacterium]|nr:TAT-variant-translocated molybdopterin oxidoreductase [bacterium]
MSNDRYDFTELRKRLAEKQGSYYWRSLDELAETPEFQDFLRHEFPENADQWKDGVSRRNFLKIMGASFAFAGLTACTRQPLEKIVPYVRQPEEIVPGRPLYFATAMQLGGIANGLLVESHMGRPTKIEGNPDHPASLGATDVFSQASILTMYDPDRSRAIFHLGNIGSWSQFLEVLRLRMAVEKQRPVPGSGLRILTETITSPTMGRQIDDLLKQLPGTKWHQYEPVTNDNTREGARLAFGDYVNTYYRFDQAAVVVSFESDFLNCGPAHVRYVRDFMTRRRVRGGQGAMNRLYCFESTPSNTGTVADHRWRKKPTEILDSIQQLYSAVVNSGAASGELKVVADDLIKNPGASIILAGDSLPPEIHAMIHSLNQHLQNAGRTILHTDPLEVRPVNQMESLRNLVQDMNKGIVETLLIVGGNPVYNTPADIGFAGALGKIDLRIHLSLYNDETSDICHWHIPEAHFLEMWSDARAYDGTVSIIQPLITPLYGGKSAHELFAAMSGSLDPNGYDIVRSYWQQQAPADFEKFWRRSLHDGVIAGTSLQARSMTAQSATPKPVASTSGLTVLFRPDSGVHDGRFANNGWLQELPRPHTKLTWDNAFMVSPATAEKLGLHSSAEVEVSHDGRSARGAVWILPGQADDTITVHLGYGRTRAGRVGNGAGFNAYALQNSKSPWTLFGAKLEKTGAKIPLACTQSHQSMEGRHLVRSGSLDEYLRNPNFAQEIEPDPPREETLYTNYDYNGYAWGMAIDLNACVGCNACVVACNSENNVPVVGKDQVMRGREMPWIRIDRYYEGDLDDPAIHNQPVTCMQCENAPCEVVCPVQATVHSSEGLNDMVYNRCVGTRYCSNNCPYKVRRFNFILYSDIKSPSMKMMRNPDVTVRTRGVMEKCTYCVQRINYAKMEAEKENRRVKDGEIQTACQQVCPAEAIVFGDINDKSSKVSQLKAESLNYGLLTHLNTRPRTTYLANLRNPNPQIPKKGHHE